jgi:hypothetical protein
VLVVALLGACDPGGSYRVPGGTEVMDNGRRFDLAGNSGTSLRVYASWFTSSVRVELAITNKGSTDLSISPKQLRAADRKGPLHRRDARGGIRCAGREGEELVTLRPGDTCQMSSDFAVHVDRDQLRTLTVAHDGVTRDGAGVPVSVKLELD